MKNGSRIFSFEGEFETNPRLQASSNQLQYSE